MSSPPEVKGSVATSMGELLEHLGERSSAQRADASVVVPRATLLLASGEWVAGQVLAVSEQRETALVATGGQNYTLVKIDQVSAATVVADRDVARLFGERAPQPARTPTKLELSRKLQALSSSLGDQVDGLSVRVQFADFGQNEPTMLELGSVIAEMSAVLRGLAADSLGREALTKIDVVDLSRGTAPEARVDGTVLRLAARVNGDHITAPDADMIEAAL